MAEGEHGGAAREQGGASWEQEGAKGEHIAETGVSQGRVSVNRGCTKVQPDPPSIYSNSTPDEIIAYVERMRVPPMNFSLIKSLLILYSSYSICSAYTFKIYKI